MQDCNLLGSNKTFLSLSLSFEYCANPCLGYELMLFWDKRDTFLMLWSMMQNMSISHNFQNGTESSSSESER